MAEGRVMQTLVERQVQEQLGEEKDVRILGKEITEVPRSHDSFGRSRKLPQMLCQK